MKPGRLRMGAIVAAGVLAVLFLIGATVVLGDDGAEASASTSSTVVVVDDQVWVTSPDDGSVAVLDRNTLGEVERFDVGGSPSQLARVGSATVVTNRAADHVNVIDPDGTVRELRVPCGGTDGVAAVPGDTAQALIGCPFDARVLLVDPRAGHVVGWIEVGGRPAGLTATAERVTVAGDSDGRLWSFDPAELPATGDGGPLDVEAVGEEVWREPDSGVTMLRSVVATGPTDVAAVYQMVDNDAERPAGSDGSYGSLTDGNPRIEPLASGPCGSHFAHFDRSDRELSGPVASAWDDEHDRLWVVGRFTQTVSVLDCLPGGDAGSDAEVIATYRVGEGARGITLAPDGLTALVDVGFDHSIAELRLDPDAPAFGDETERVVRRPTGSITLSHQAQAGRRIFNDARNRHLTPSGVAACATCHLDGGDDGVTWRISTDEIPTKLSRTPPMWELADGSKDLHWDGQFASAAELTSDTIRNLLGGDGLLVDTSKVAAYLAEIEPPPPAPSTDAVDADIEEGRKVFESGCAGCHSGARGSDGLAHDLDRAAVDPDGDLDQVITPTLLGTRARAP